MRTTELLYTHFLQHPIICTDTRTIVKDCLFFALKGDNFDANTFALKALDAGAALVIIDDVQYNVNERCFLVEDVLTALQDLAAYHRKQLNIPIIGLTGSNGKTTTKELIKAALSEQFKTFATKGNLNNHIGVPLSILSIDKTIEIAVIEMGANHQGEIAALCKIAQPTHGLITNIGMAHLDGFGGFEGVKKGKAELYKWLSENNGVAFINGENTILTEIAALYNLPQIVWYGNKVDSLVKGNLISAAPMLQIGWATADEQFEARLNITGAYNYENALAAICIGLFFNLDNSAIKKGLEGYMPVNNRSQITKTANNTVICDFYNANPSSMLAAITNLSVQENKLKAAILGDMFELGDEGAQQHFKVLEKAIAGNFNQLIFIGNYFYEFKSGEALFFKTPTEAAVYLQANPIKQHLILLKGSRGMALEQLMHLL